MWADKEQALTFGRIVKKARLAKGLTGAQLAAKALGTNANKSLISKIETGANLNPMPDTVKALCDALGITEETVKIILDGGHPETISDDLNHLRKENGSLLASLEDLKQRTRAQLEALATRFEIPQAFSLLDTELITRLNEAADEFRARVKSRKEPAPSQFADLETEIAAAEQDVDLKRIAAAREKLSALKREIYEDAKGRADAAQQTAQETLLELVAEEETRAANALLRNRAKQAFSILNSAAEELAEFDPKLGAEKRNVYFKLLFNFSLRNGPQTLNLAADIVRPAVSSMKGTPHIEIYGWSLGNLSNAIIRRAKHSSGKSKTKYLQEAEDIYREIAKIFPDPSHGDNWITLMDNWGNLKQMIGASFEGAKSVKELKAAAQFQIDFVKSNLLKENPFPRARALANLSITQCELGKRQGLGEGRDSLRSATASGWAALSIVNSLMEGAANLFGLTSPQLSQLKSSIQLALGNAQSALGSITFDDEGDALLRGSLATFKEALAFRTQKERPMEWALVQDSVATSHFSLATRLKGVERENHKRCAILHANIALEVFEAKRSNADVLRLKLLLADIKARL